MLSTPLRPFGIALVISGFAALSASATDFKKQILPILQKKCVDCHSEAKKVKGKFDINKPETFAENVKAGSPDVSKLATSIGLPDDDEDVMPPKGKNKMTPAEVALVKAWITEGASFAAGGAKPAPGAPPAAAAPAAGAAQTWTNAAGKSLQAVFDRLEGDAVVIKTADGKYFTVPLAGLSQESQEQAKKDAGQ
ncbi:MAG: hypothetical protein JWO94_789 [Verrucomicrobiaceae bacterium]|nr:hypothetical protein [Verrucomicrobiaceae bacterium]